MNTMLVILVLVLGLVQVIDAQTVTCKFRQGGTGFTPKVFVNGASRTISGADNTFTFTEPSSESVMAILVKGSDNGTPTSTNAGMVLSCSTTNPVPVPWTFASNAFSGWVPMACDSSCQTSGSTTWGLNNFQVPVDANNPLRVVTSTSSSPSITGISNDTSSRIWVSATNQFIVFRKTFGVRFVNNPDLLTVIPSNCTNPNFKHNFGGRCYFYSVTDGPSVSPTRPINTEWFNAFSICGLMDGFLASIHTAEENSFIHFTMGPAGSPLRGCGTNDFGNNCCNKGVCWLGLYQTQGQSGVVYQWADGSYYSVSTAFFDLGEPNNVGSSGEDCVHTWDRTNGNPPLTPSKWNDEPCSNQYPYICTQVASCPVGFRLAVPYTGIPRPGYFEGLCEQCPIGKFRGSSDSQDLCISCPPGRFGTAKGEASCGGTCGVGEFCPLGSTVSTKSLCPPGKFGLSGVSVRSTEANSCGVCPAGSFCLGGVSPATPCPAGQCSVAGDTGNANGNGCSSDCPAGYYCPLGSACNVPGTSGTVGRFECGFASGGGLTLDKFFCPGGEGSPNTVTDGFFSDGGDSRTTRTSSVECPKGAYCKDGVKTLCAAGKFNSLTRRVFESACSTCTAGYFCTEGSTSATQNSCAASNDPKPQLKYCPPGSSTSQTISTSGFYTLPETPESNFTRESFAVCPPDSVCTDGLRRPKIVWNSNSCPNFVRTVNANEGLGVNALVGFTAQVNLDSALNSSLYTITYSINSSAFFDPTKLTCITPANAANTFSLNSNSGVLRFSRANVNFEICLPVQDIRYNVLVRARAVGEGTTSEIFCNLQVVIDDVNDDPKTTAPTIFRVIEEKSSRNTPVSVCNSVTQTAGLCSDQSALDTEVEKLFSDEDFGSVITFSFVKNAFDEGLGLFAINPCSGLIIFQGNDPNALSFTNAPTVSGAISGTGKGFRLQINATDDGNGGAFARKSVISTLTIFLTNKNDPPQLPTDVTFQVFENSPPGTELQILPSGGDFLSRVTDEDGDSISLSLQDVDSNAFRLSPNGRNLVVNDGAILNFESTKTNFTVGISAFDNKTSAVRTYTVMILNANDPPRLTNGTIFFVRENSPANTPVCREPIATGSCTASIDHQFRVEDDDRPTETLPTLFTLFNAANAVSNEFQIDSVGQIRVKSNANLDFENLNLTLLSNTGRGYIVRISACSQGFGSAPETNTTKCLNVNATIFLVDVNEAPTFPTGNRPVFSIIEKVWPIGSSVLFDNTNLNLITATDPDNSDTNALNPSFQTLIYDIVPSGVPGNDDGLNIFNVVTDSSGLVPIISLRSAVSLTSTPSASCQVAPCYLIRIRATDTGSGASSVTSGLIEIRVLPANEPPFFAASLPVIRTISENALKANAVTTTGGSITVSDPDNDSLTFTLIGGSGKDDFELDNVTGNSFQVRKQAGRALDFEGPAGSTLTVVVEAKDSGKSKRIGSSCESVGDDCGFSTQGGASCNPFDKRCIEVCVNTTGVVTNSAVVASRPRINGYFCNYTAGENPSKIFPETFELTVTINILDANDAPRLVSDLLFANGSVVPIESCALVRSITINSLTATNVVVSPNSLQVFDQDVNDTSGFSFAIVNSPVQFTNRFSLQSSSTGEIHWDKNSVGLVPDQVLEGFIRVTDTRGASSDCLLQVKAVESNTPPSIVPVARITLDENVAPNTVIVPSLQVNDPDVGDTVVFSTSFSPIYTLNPSTGQILIASGSLNFEAAGLTTVTGGRELQILVQAKDSKNAVGTTIITVLIRDLNEAPVLKALPSPVFSLDENSLGGTLVGTPMSNFIEDPDQDPSSNPAFRTLTYSIVSCNGVNPCPFVINSGTGQISVANNAVLNFEGSINSYSLLIQASDGGSPSLSLQTPLGVNIVLLDVNEKPRFTQSGVLQVFINEDDTRSIASTPIADLSNLVQDEDSNQTLTIQVVSGAGFTVVNNRLFFNQFLDFEASTTQQVTLNVTDGVLTSDPKIVQIVVQNVNDVSIDSVSILGTSSTVMSCSGGNKIVISGKNFGYKTGAGPAATVTVTYRYQKTTSESITPIVYTATGCSVTVRNTEIQCDSVPGVGVNFVWTVSIQATGINNNTATSSSTFLSYSVPTLSSVNGALNVATIGGSVVQLIGTCLSRSSDSLNFNHSSTSNRESFVQYCTSAQTCFVPRCLASSSLNGPLSCVILPGVGGNFLWNVKIAGQTISGPLSSGSYAPPVLSAVSFNVFQTNGVFTNSPLIISGSNFGDTGEVPSAAFARYSYVDTETGLSTFLDYALSGCIVTSASGLRNQITCSRIEPGIGSSMNLFIAFGGQSNNPGQVLVRYAGSTVTKISGGLNTPTFGGFQVSIEGSGFGPSCGIPGVSGCGRVRGRYSRVPTNIQYLPSCAVVDDSKMICTLEEGTGANHVWTFNIGSQTTSVTSNAGTTSYGPPSVGAFEGPGARNANTEGAESVILIGSNFGPLNGAPIFAFYGPENDPREFLVSSCSVVLAHTKIECFTQQGAGFAHSWTVVVDDQESVGVLMSYGVPTLQSIIGISGANKDNLNPDGGEIIRITGGNFGPSSGNPSYPERFPYLQGVLFGPEQSPSAYAGLNCILTTPHAEIECTTPPGIGTNLIWKVLVGGQESATTLSLRTSYQVPSLISLSVSSSGTEGGVITLLEGEGFPLCDTDSRIEVFFGNGLVSSVRVLDDNNDPILGCPLVRPSVQKLEFVVPPMTLSRVVPVTAQIQTRKFSNSIIQASGVINFEYDPPILTSVFAERTEGSDLLLLNLIGENLCASENCCATVVDGRIASSSVISHSHGSIVLRISSANSIFVRCFLPSVVDSNSVAVNELSPFILGTNPPLISTRFHTNGNETFELWGLHFGASPVIRINGTVADIFSPSTIVDCFSDADGVRPETMLGFLLEATATCFKVVVSVPPGKGERLPMIVEVGTTRSLADDDRFDFISYRKPVIFSVSGLGVSTNNTSAGNKRIVIQGSSFGVDGVVRLGDSNRNLSCIISNGGSYSHDVIECDTPPGEGANLTITVVVGGQVSTPACCVNYIPPIISDWTISGLGVGELARTIGGQTLILTGSNFGRSSALQVRVDGRICKVLTDTAPLFNQVQCRVPAGEGLGGIVTADAGGQVASSSKLFDYAKPQILSVNPLTGPTSGLSNESDPNSQIFMEIIGDNFGVDRLRVEFNGIAVIRRLLPSQTAGLIANHTVLRFPLPKFLGKNLPIRVIVDSQINEETTFNFTYFAPDVDSITFRKGDAGELTQSVSEGSQLIGGKLPRQVFASSSSARRRNLQQEEASYGAWTRDFTSCEGNFLLPEIFWRTKTSINENGTFERITDFYDVPGCPVNSSAYRINETGIFQDFGEIAEDVFYCGQKYREVINGVFVTPLSDKAAAQVQLDGTCGAGPWTNGLRVSLSSGNICAFFMKMIKRSVDAEAITSLNSLTAFGMYVVADKTDLYMSKPVYSSAEQVDADSSAYDMPVEATSITLNPSVLLTPEGPTDGCWEWEDIGDYNLRVALSIQVNGTADIPRLCIDPATLDITGVDFGSDALGEEGSLRVFFVDPLTNVSYEGSTTTSKGSHGEFCTFPQCLHTDSRIRFRIPFGTGSGLEIHIDVGGQVRVVQNITFTYSGPRLREQLPGSVWNRRGFSKAEGNEELVIRGLNFGNGESVVGVLLNGRVCSDASWQTGEADQDGLPFVSCKSKVDVVGPRSVFLCVAEQTTTKQVFARDSAVLLEGETKNAWVTGGSAQGYDTQLSSFSHARCGEGKSGRLFELCRNCPIGADCNPPGSFLSAPALPTFFKIEIPVRLEDGELNPRAIERCDQGQWNTSLLTEFPDLVFRETCEDYVRCVPEEACQSSNLCTTGYQYAFNQCLEARSAPGFDNTCSVILNPFTNEFVGNHSACIGQGKVVGEACDPSRPWECSSCVVRLDDNLVPFGTCECAQPNRCGLCTANEYFRLNGVCVECPASPELLIALFILAGLALIAAGYILQRKNFNLAFISIGIDYFQVLSILASTNIEWPPELLNLFNVFTIFNFNIDITAPECLVPDLSYEVKWWFSMVLPLLAFSILLVILLLLSFYKLIRLGHQFNLVGHASSLIAIGVVLMYYMYLSVTKRALDVFNCNPVDPDDGQLYTDFTSLDCDGGGLCRCNEPGGLQVRLQPLAIAFLLLYTVGFPAFILSVWIRSKRSMMVDQYFRAAGFGEERTSNPYYDLRKRYSKLYYHFKPQYTFWIVVIVMRKLAIAAAALLLRSNGSFQLAIIVLILFVAFILQVLKNPYMSTNERESVIEDLRNKVARSELEPRFRPFVSILEEVKKNQRLHVAEQRKDKVRAFGLNSIGFFGNSKGNEKDDMKAKNRNARRAIVFLFDFNVVEMVLLGCAILVSLSGLMFASGRFEESANLQAQRQAIAYITVIVVIFSISYYFLVFLAELAPYFIGYLVQRCCMSKVIDEEEKLRADSLRIEENPMFSQAGPKFADTAEISGKLEMVSAQLQQAEKENQILREKIRTAKQQQLEVSTSAIVGQAAPAAKVTRKQFGQQMGS